MSQIYLQKAWEVCQQLIGSMKISTIGESTVFLKFKYRNRVPVDWFIQKSPLLTSVASSSLSVAWHLSLLKTSVLLQAVEWFIGKVKIN